MEDIEYLDEYKDLVLPVSGMKMGEPRPSAPPSSSSDARKRRRISSDSSNSSSIDADIFQKLFHGKIIDDELFKGAPGKPQSKHRPLSSSSSDESNDALDILFDPRRSHKTRPRKQRERYDSVDSVYDLDPSLIREAYRTDRPGPSLAGARRGSGHLFGKPASSSSTGTGTGTGASTSKLMSAKHGAGSSSASTRSSGSCHVNGDSKPQKALAFVQAPKTKMRPKKQEPKTDPLNLLDYLSETESDSSYEYESDFYGDRDSEDDEPEPVIDISTDTSRSTSVADTVTPVVSDDEGQQQASDQHGELQVRESVIASVQSYLKNLNSAEAPPMYRKQGSARKSRSNEKKQPPVPQEPPPPTPPPPPPPSPPPPPPPPLSPPPPPPPPPTPPPPPPPPSSPPSSSSEQVKHAIERPAASGKEEHEQGPAPGAANAANAANAASSSSAGRKPYDIDESLTLETLERMSLDLAEQISEIDAERSCEFERLSGSRRPSRSPSKLCAVTSSNPNLSYVRKLTFSSEAMEDSDEKSHKLRRAKSDTVFAKQRRPRGQKKRQNRAATTEEKVEVKPEAGVEVKKKRGRPRKKDLPEKAKSTVDTSGVPPVSVQASELKHENNESDSKEVKTEEQVVLKEQEQVEVGPKEQQNQKEDPKEREQKEVVLKEQEQKEVDPEEQEQKEGDPKDQEQKEVVPQEHKTPGGATKIDELDKAKEIPGLVTSSQKITSTPISQQTKDLKNETENDESSKATSNQSLPQQDAENNNRTGTVKKSSHKRVVIEKTTENEDVDVESELQKAFGEKSGSLGDSIEVSANGEAKDLEIPRRQEVGDVSTEKSEAETTEEYVDVENLTKGSNPEIPGPQGEMVGPGKVTKNLHEVSDSQLAEDIKLAEEIMAAELGTSVDMTDTDQEDPVTQIVKELEEEAIAEAAQKIQEQSTAEEPSLARDYSSPDEAEVPSISSTPTSNRKPKNSDETASGVSSVARRTLRSAGTTPTAEHETRSRRSGDLSLISDEPLKRTSPRLGPSSKESDGGSSVSAKKKRKGFESTTPFSNKTEKPRKKRVKGVDYLSAEDKPNCSETDTEKPEAVKAPKALEKHIGENMEERGVETQLKSEKKCMEETKGIKDVPVACHSSSCETAVKCESVLGKPNKIRKSRKGKSKLIEEHKNTSNLPPETSAGMDSIPTSATEVKSNIRKPRGTPKNPKISECVSSTERPKNVSSVSNRESVVLSDKDEKRSERLSRRDKEFSHTPKKPANEELALDEKGNIKVSRTKKQTSKDRKKRSNQDLKLLDQSQLVELDKGRQTYDSPIESETDSDECLLSRKIKQKRRKKKLIFLRSVGSSADTAKMSATTVKSESAIKKDGPNEDIEKAGDALEINNESENCAASVESSKDKIIDEPFKEPSPEESLLLFPETKMPTKTYLKHYRKKPAAPTTDDPQATAILPSILSDNEPESSGKGKSKGNKKNSDDLDKVSAEILRTPPESSKKTLETLEEPTPTSKPEDSVDSCSPSSASCRKLRVRIKRTPNTNKRVEKSRILPIQRKTPANRKRFKKILSCIEETPLSMDDEPTNQSVESHPEVVPDPDSHPEGLPGSESHPEDLPVPDPEIKQYEEVPNLTTDEPMSSDIQEEPRTTSETIAEPQPQEGAPTGDPDPTGDPELVANEEPSTEVVNKMEEEQEAILAALYSDTKPSPEELVGGVQDTKVEDTTEDKPEAAALPETTTETTGVTVDTESEVSTSSMLTRSLRKRDADSSQPDEAAKRKQAMEKSVTSNKDRVNAVRRRNQVETEERHFVKRAKVEPGATQRHTSREFKSESTKTSSSAKKGADAKGSRSSSLSSSTAGKKSMDRPSGSGKKTLVQTVLSPTLNLQKPKQEDVAKSSGRKSLNKPESSHTEDEASTSLGTSVVLTKKSVSATKSVESAKDEAPSSSPRKVNISVTVLDPKESLAETPTHSSAAIGTATAKTSRKSEGKNVEAKKANRKSEATNEASKKVDSVTVIDRKAVAQSDGTDRKLGEGSKAEKTGAELTAHKKDSATPKSDAEALVAGPSKKSGAKKSEGSPSTKAKPLESPKKDASDEIPTSAANKLEASTKLRTLKQMKDKLGASSESLASVPRSRDSSHEDPTRTGSALAVPARLMAGRSPPLTRASSSSRSLTATPTPERYTQTPGTRGRGRGGRRMPVSQKRKADDEAATTTNAKRVKEQEIMPEEQQTDRGIESLAFPVKITVASMKEVEDPATASASDPAPAPDPVPVPAATPDPAPTAAPVPVSVPSQASGPRKRQKLCVKINRRPFTLWQKEQLRKRMESQMARSESYLESGSESAAGTVQDSPLLGLEHPGGGTDDLLQIRKNIDLAYISAAPSSLTTGGLLPGSAPAQASAPAGAPPPVSAAPPTTVPASAPAPSTQLLTGATRDKPVVQNNSQPKAKVGPVNTIPLPVPIQELKDEPVYEPAEPMDQDAQPMPIVNDPSAMSLPPIHNGRQVITVNPALQIASSSIPSASTAPSTPNAIGQTKMFSFLHPTKYVSSYGRVGLDYCCPNLDGPMRAIDPTRLHDKVEVPVLELPQYLVITTKFISKADKNIPNKVRAKLEMLGKEKGQDKPETADVPVAAPMAPEPPAQIPQCLPPVPAQELTVRQGLSLPAVPAPSVAPLVAPSPLVIPAPATTESVDMSLESLDSLTKQLPKGTTLTKKFVAPGTVVSPMISSPIAPPQNPTLIQLPPICPTDKQRMELQSRVQIFDMVLQTLSRRATTLTVAERQRAIEEIVKTSSLMSIDVDVGTKLLENYVHYLNMTTSANITLPTVLIAPVLPTPAPAPAQSSASPQATTSTAKKSVPKKQRSSLPAHVGNRVASPIDKSRKKGSPATSSPVASSLSRTATASSSATKPTASKTSRKSSAASTSKATTDSTPKATSSFAGGKKSLADSTISAINSPKTATGRAKATSARTASASSKKPASGRASSKTATTSGSRASVPQPNVFIINQLAHPEECILPDSNDSAKPMETEIKGEIDDAEALI
ncbi:hypothetical protein KR018_010289 [Drosophila ironensis]|nr:hypothetical protein KR018_010289 [Drosophila ironensis]